MIYFCCTGISGAIKMIELYKVLQMLWFQSGHIIDSGLCSSLIFIVFLYF